jgi:ABC-2 type transport system permease protein
MLWSKAWLETRFRFCMGAGLVAAVTAFFVFVHPFVTRQWRADRVLHPEWAEPEWLGRALVDYPFFLWHFLFADLLQSTWILCAVLLGLGGVAREAAQGSAGFTLSLPVTRRRLLAVRTAVGGAEVLALGLVPAILVPALSAAAGRAYPPGQALAHSLLMAVGGLVFFALSVLLSTLLRDEHTPLLVGVSVAAVLYFVVQPYADGRTAGPAWVRWVNVPRLMAGPPELTSLSDVPWLALAVSAAIAAALLAASFRINDARDF